MSGMKLRCRLTPKADESRNHEAKSEADSLIAKREQYPMARQANDRSTSRGTTLLMW
jgi:hypothetical protein